MKIPETIPKIICIIILEMKVDSWMPFSLLHNDRHSEEPKLPFMEKLHINIIVFLSQQNRIDIT